MDSSHTKQTMFFGDHTSHMSKDQLANGRRAAFIDIHNNRVNQKLFTFTPAHLPANNLKSGAISARGYSSTQNVPS